MEKMGLRQTFDRQNIYTASIRFLFENGEVGIGCDFPEKRFTFYLRVSLSLAVRRGPPCL